MYVFMMMMMFGGQMPFLDGFEATEVIRKEEAAYGIHISHSDCCTNGAFDAGGNH